MWEFFIGFFAGATTGRLILIRNSKTRDAMVQADELIITPTRPISIPNETKKFKPGSLANFWGDDSQ
jgi:hypothetical protein